jgi:NAD(P)-dependent dehydrogenase (short-subunit alcohol dehydrogenase family)
MTSAAYALVMSVVGVAHVETRAPQRGTAVVTGGSRGIGAACSRKLAANGYGVVVAYISDGAAATRVCEDIRASGGLAVAQRADVSIEADVVALFELADASFGGASPLRVLVNNAGMLGPGGNDLQDQANTPAVLAHILAVNVGGPMLCCREAQRRMSTARGGAGGAIVQISSGSAYIGTPLLYSASKGESQAPTLGSRLARMCTVGRTHPHPRATCATRSPQARSTR